ncbi:MAG: hypothetical protein ABIE46_00630 [Patescibacteria group bacterium]
MKVYKTKISKLSGSDYKEVSKKAFGLYTEIKKKTKRRPYVRSVYFNKSKIFIELFWLRIWENQNFRDKIRRIKYFPCAIELIQKCKFDPASKQNPNKSTEVLHRFAGTTKENDLFYVQIKEDKKTGEKWLMSVFPEEF